MIRAVSQRTLGQHVAREIPVQERALEETVFHKSFCYLPRHPPSTLFHKVPAGKNHVAHGKLDS